MSNAQSIISSHKDAAKRATEYLGQARNLKLKPAEALELVARVLGVANWQTLNAMAKQGKAPRMAVSDMLSPADSIESRARQMAEMYSAANGWGEHPFLLREDWVSCDTGTDDGLEYWRFVIRRLEEIKAIMPWDREVIEDVQVARAAGIDIDYDFGDESWGVASAEDDEFLDLEVQSSEREAWRVAAAAAGVVVAYQLAKELPWKDMSLADKLVAIGKAMPWVAEAGNRAAGVTTPKLVPPLPVTREQLLAGGFKVVTRDGVEGEFLVKTLQARQMPYVLEHIVGTCEVEKDSIATLEVDPQGMLTLAIGEEYKEDPIALDHEDARGVLRDGGLDV